MDYIPIAIPNGEEVDALVRHRLYDRTRANEIVGVCHVLAGVLDYQGSILWQVQAGCRLCVEIPRMGECNCNLGFLPRWGVEDAPTTDALVFWIPRLLPESMGKCRYVQTVQLQGIRQRHGLPEKYFDDFGTAAMISALIWAQRRHSDERVPLGYQIARTSTRYRSGWIDVGFSGNKLDCYGVDIQDRDLNTGSFLIAVEALPSA